MQIVQSGKTCFYGVFHVCSRDNGRVRNDSYWAVRYFDHDDKGKETRLDDIVLDFVLNKFYVVLARVWLACLTKHHLELQGNFEIIY